MGALLVQVGNIVSTFSCKFNDAQLKYMVTRQELLATAKACKHFEQISCGCKIRIHTHHQKLMHIHMMHANLQEQQTCIFLNTEFVPTFVYITGRENTRADSLSQLLMLDQVRAETTHQLFAISNLDRNTDHDFLLDMHQIQCTQAKDKGLSKHVDQA